jgi:hypothetical protein
MSLMNFLVIATFTAPEYIRPNPQAMLWLLPLTAAIAIVYKATKLPTITLGSFLKEAAVLFGSIIAFIIITALALYALVWLISV